MPVRRIERTLPFKRRARAGSVQAMPKLIYSAIASLDGYVADEQGTWDWSMPSEEVHAFVNDLSRPLGTWLLGRRMYDVLVAWETMDDPAPLMRDFADIWRSADKIVYSRTLEAASSARTRIEREFDPAAVRRLKDESERDLSVSGPELAAQAFRAGLVDELQLFLSPIVVGGGNPALPDDARVPLELLDERRFDNGVVYLSYRVTA
jgi:dihydrofolate reductase